MEITFLGTSCMTHTKERNQSAVFLTYKSDGILFDCGEATQRQLRIAGLKLPQITKILLTHWHGDHVLGLPGLIQTLSMSNHQKQVDIYGPPGIRRQVKDAFDAFRVKAAFPLTVNEVQPGTFFQNEDFMLQAAPLKHTIPCVAYAFVEKDKRRIDIAVTKKLNLPEGPLLGELQRGNTITWENKKITPEKATQLIKGKKIVYLMDTLLTKECFQIAQEADILICEATVTSELKEKAEEYHHLTALEAAQIASKANAKKLILTHFSQRYKNTQEIEEDARTAFDNIVCAKDFMHLRL